MSCVDFANGRCNRDRCKYEHGDAQTTPPQMTQSYGATSNGYGGYGASTSNGTYGATSNGTTSYGANGYGATPASGYGATTGATYGATSGSVDPSDPAAYLASYAQSYQAAFAAAAANGANGYGSSSSNSIANGAASNAYGAQAYGGYGATNAFPQMTSSTYSAPYGGYGASPYGAAPYGAYGGGHQDSNACRDYRMGRCTRGESCRFQHVGAPHMGGGMVQGRNEVCGDFLKGRCLRGDMCRYSHNKQQGPPCRDFLKGLCTRGDACRYHHYDAASLPPCRDYQRGRCDRISDCKYAHDRNDLTAAQLMLQGMQTYTGESNGMHSSAGFSAPGSAYSGGGQYGAAPTSDGAYSGYGGNGGYAASDSAPSADGTGANGPSVTTYGDDSATHTSPAKSSADTDSRMPSGSSGRKRAREDESANTQPEHPNSDEQPDDSTKPPTTGDGLTPDSGERPSKMQKVGDQPSETAESGEPKSDSTETPSLTGSATRGADGKALEASAIGSIEGGPDPTLLGGSSAPGSVGAQLNAGTQSADSAPSTGGSGAALDGGGQPTTGGGAGGGPGGPA